jgi:hypothetical protein
VRNSHLVTKIFTSSLESSRMIFSTEFPIFLVLWEMEHLSHGNFSSARLPTQEMAHSTYDIALLRSC